MEAAFSGRLGGRLPVGRWGVYEGGARKGEGGASGPRGGLERWAQSSGRRVRVSGIDRELVRLAPRPQKAWPAAAPLSGHWGWAPRALGGGQVYPESEEQRCWNHRIINLLDKLPKKHHADAKRRLRQIAYAETREQAEKQKRTFQLWCKERHFEAAADCLDHDWERMVSFYRYPKRALDPPAHHQSHRIALSPRCGYGPMRRNASSGVDNATALIWKTLMIAEKTFRRLNAPELLKDVYQGTVYLIRDLPSENNLSAA